MLHNCLTHKNNEYQNYLNATLGFLFDKYELDGLNFDNNQGYLLIENPLFQQALRKMLMTSLELEHFLISKKK